MADTSTMTAAQITAASTTPTSRTLIPAVTSTVVIAGTQFRIYEADTSSPSPGWHLEVRNQGLIVDVQVSSYSGLITAEKSALQALIEKLHVQLVAP